MDALGPPITVHARMGPQITDPATHLLPATITDGRKMIDTAAIHALHIDIAPRALQGVETTIGIGTATVGGTTETAKGDLITHHRGRIAIEDLTVIEMIGGLGIIDADDELPQPHSAHHHFVRLCGTCNLVHIPSCATAATASRLGETRDTRRPELDVSKLLVRGRI